MTTDADKTKTVAAVMAAKREAREAEKQRRADAQARADKRPAQGRGTT